MDNKNTHEFVEKLRENQEKDRENREKQGDNHLEKNYRIISIN